MTLRTIALGDGLALPAGYGWFTEGLETRALKEAKALLEEFR